MRAIRDELEWVRSSPKARQTKSKARISAFEDLVAKSQEKAVGPAVISVPPGPRLGGKVIEAENVSKAFGDNLLYENLNFRLPPGGIVGIIGPNGAGKTTLFRMITGAEQPSSGTFTVGDTVVLGYVDQSRDSLDPDKTVFEEISDGQEEIDLGKRKINSRALCRPVQLQGRRPAEEGGRAVGRRAQPRPSGQDAVASPPTSSCWTNPPTTWTWKPLSALEDALAEFPGCAVVISHDRFLPGPHRHPTSWPSRANPRWCGSRATTRITRPTASDAWAPTPTSPTASSTSR